MKKLLIYFLFISSVVVAQAAANTMSMVTYFPVPYVAYNDIGVANELDVGLGTTCSLNLGCSSATAQPLKTKDLRLQSGTLSLESTGKIVNTDTFIGSGSAAAKVRFSGTGHTLVVGSDLQAKTLNTTQLSVESLTLFGKPFPSCKRYSSDGQMRWSSLALGSNKNTKEIYLQCGASVEQEQCSPENEGKERFTAPCSGGLTGSIIYTWNYTTCQYDETNTCAGDCNNATYKANHKAECCPSASESDTTCYTKSYKWGAKVEKINIDTRVFYLAHYYRNVNPSNPSPYNDYHCFGDQYTSTDLNYMNMQVDLQTNGLDETYPFECTDSYVKSLSGQTCSPVYGPSEPNGVLPVKFCLQRGSDWVRAYQGQAGGYATFIQTNHQGGIEKGNGKGDSANYYCKYNVQAWPGIACKEDGVTRNGW